MASHSAQAGADIVHANTTTNFENTASWVGGVVPTSVDFAVFNNVSTAGNTAMTYNSSTNLTLGGFKIVDPGAAVVFAIASGRTFTFGGATTTGTSGIDMSAATQDFTISTAGTGFFRFNTVSQTWNVAANRTLTINGNWSTQGSSKTLTLTGAGNIVINSSVDASGTTTHITPARISSDIFMLLRRNERAQLGSRPRPVPEIC